MPPVIKKPTAYKPAAKGEGRSPDYTVSALSKATEHRGSIGAAWINDDGTISIKLNAFVVLSAIDEPTIRLFPYSPLPKKMDRPVPPPKHSTFEDGTEPIDVHSEIPFDDQPSDGIPF